MICAHLTASRFFGGPERQMLGLATALRDRVDSHFLSFAENGHCRSFIDEVTRAGFESLTLSHDTPHLFAAFCELVSYLRQRRVSVLCCHEYKSNTIGLLAARAVGIPVVGVSRGWTGENLRIRCYEQLDRQLLRRMDGVVCVSNAQATRVRQSGVRGDKIVVIHNAISTDRFVSPNPDFRERLKAMFPSQPDCIVGAAGRLSSEKGFAVLVDAAAVVVSQFPSAGFVLFGEGALRAEIESQINRRRLHNNFVLGGFCPQLDQFMPHFDIVALPSFTEGLPNVALEAMAVGLPVVGTDVGGIPEVVSEGETGFVVPPANTAALAERIAALIRAPEKRRVMGEAGRLRIEQEFDFAAQASSYEKLFEGLLTCCTARGRTRHIGEQARCDALVRHE